MVLENETEPTLKEEGQEQTQVEQGAETQQAQETVESLKQQLEQYQTQLKKREDDVRGLNKTLQQRAEEAKKQDDLRGEIAGIQDTIELLATAVSARGQIDDVDPEQRQDILSELRKRRTQQETQRKQVEAQREQQEYNQKADSVFTRAKAIYGDNDDAIDRIEELLLNGRLDRAEARVAKAEQVKGEKPKVTETEEQRINRLVDEKLKSEMEKRGLLEEHSRQPRSGGSGKTPTTEELAASTPFETAARVKSGEWIVRGWTP